MVGTPGRTVGVVVAASALDGIGWTDTKGSKLTPRRVPTAAEGEAPVPVAKPSPCVASGAARQKLVWVVVGGKTDGGGAERPGLEGGYTDGFGAVTGGAVATDAGNGTWAVVGGIVAGGANAECRTAVVGGGAGAAEPDVPRGG